MSSQNNPYRLVLASSENSTILSAQEIKSQFPGADIEFADVGTLFPVDVEADDYRHQRLTGSNRSLNVRRRSRRYDFD